MSFKGYKREIKLEFDYEEVRKGIPSVNKQMAILNAEFRKSYEQARETGSATEQLGIRYEFLSEKINIQTKEVEAYRKKLDEVEKAGGNNAKALENASTNLEIANANLKRTEAQLGQVTNELKEQNTVLGMTSDKWRETGASIGDIGKSMTMKFTTPILAAGAASFKMAADYEDAFGKAEVVFGRNIGTIKKWSDASFENFGIARKVALDMATDFSAGFNQMGVTLDKSTDMGKKLTELTMDMVTYYNTTIDETNRAMSAILSGQTEPLKRFNIFMTQANLQQFAYTQGIKKQISEMTEAEKAQLRYNYVLEKTAAAHGHAKKEQGSATSEMENFKQALIQIGDKFGEVIIPLFTPFLEKINKLLETISKLDDGTKKFIITVGGIIAIGGPILIFVGSLFKAIGNISDGLGKVGDGIKVVSGAGKGIKGLLDSTKFLGFVKWASILAMVAAAIATVIAMLNILLGKGKEVNQMLGSVDNITGNLSGATNRTKVRGYAVGTNYLKQDEVLQAHKGEAIVPADNNPWNPNASNPWGSNTTEGDTFIIQVNMDEVEDVSKLVNVFKNFKQAKRGG